MKPTPMTNEELSDLHRELTRMARDGVYDASRGVIESLRLLATIAKLRGAAKMLREDLLNWQASGCEPAGLDQTFEATAWLDEVHR